MKYVNTVPLVLAIAAIVVLWEPLSLIQVCIVVTWYLFVVGLGVSIVMHRNMAHGSVEINNKFKNVVLAIFTATTSVSPCSWVVVHKLHHKYADQEKDPHPANISGVINNLTGNITVDVREGAVLARKLLTNSFVYTLHKRSKLIFYTTLVLLAVVNTSLLLLWAIVYLMYKTQGILNAYLAHKIGYRNFNVLNNSTNDIVTTVISFGEGLHNNHHANPKNANFAHTSYEVDSGYLIIKFLTKVNLAKEIT